MANSKSNFEFYQHLFHAAGEGMIVVDSQGIIVLANDRILELFGYAEGELDGANLNKLIPKKHQGHHQKRVDGYFEQPKKRLMSQSMSLSGLKKDGNEFPLEVSLNHFVTDEGRFAIGLVTDVSERKKVEKRIQELNEQLETKVRERTSQLAESQRLYSAIAKNFPEGTVNVLDLNYNYIFAEGEELKRRGISPESLVGVNLIGMLPEENQARVTTLLDGVIKGENCTFELELKGDFYELDAVPLKSEKGKVEQLLIIERNITKKKESEIEIRKALEKERELNSLKSRFVSMASHEFRTPLAAILSSVSLISKYQTEEQQPNRDKHIARIKSSVQNLTSILNDFLSLDKLEAGKVHCAPEPFFLKVMCEHVIDDMQSLLKPEQHINFYFIGEAGEVVLDRNLFRNILMNLLSNAVKYSPDGSIVHFKAQLSQDKVQIEVQDQGIGIPEEEQSHLFERFFRAKNATNLQGTGLGLNITKKHTELMQGELTFKSKLNEGSTFQVNLPRTLVSA